MNRLQMMRKKRKAETKKERMRMKRVNGKRKRRAKKAKKKELEKKKNLMTEKMKKPKKQKRGRPQQIICQILMSQDLLQKSLAWTHSLHLQVTQFLSRPTKTYLAERLPQVIMRIALLIVSNNNFYRSTAIIRRVYNRC